MSTELDAIIAKAQTNPDIKASVAGVLQGLAEKLAAKPNDAAYVGKIASQLRGASTAIGRVAVTVTAPPQPVAPALMTPQAVPIQRTDAARTPDAAPQTRQSDPIMPPQSTEADTAWRGSHEKKKGT